MVRRLSHKQEHVGPIPTRAIGACPQVRILPLLFAGLADWQRHLPSKQNRRVRSSRPVCAFVAWWHGISLPTRNNVGPIPAERTEDVAERQGTPLSTEITPVRVRSFSLFCSSKTGIAPHC